jgi:hypothetical protein
MTDKELLELAAKAADIDHPAGEHSIHNDGRLWDCNEFRWWNPLVDDADAFRLAVKLEMDIEITIGQLNHKWVWVYVGRHALTESCGNDPYTATRRAIVRAAAQIGRGME